MTVAAAGSITTILTAMKTHFSNADVQHYACAALRNLAFNENNKVAIVNADGKVVIESAMQNHSSNAGVQENGNGALRTLTLEA